MNYKTFRLTKLHFQGRLSCTPGATQVPYNRAPGVLLHSLLIEASLILILLTLRLIFVLRPSQRLSVVLTMNVLVVTFLRQVVRGAQG